MDRKTHVNFWYFIAALYSETPLKQWAIQSIQIGAESIFAPRWAAE